ncbi:hypothetical protein OEZ85_004005 [Tetradesmus obliquus]|uniref:SURP motif domain-containing protein n=1 Tax=Tetradesmus obliquus TaxID=3088 RepID=A0ABY8UGD8_TETOB|nr:hypothetical protein OEZ85_004005 [Tetradesmus obliquus]
MAGLGALLGGYGSGSDEDDEMEEGQHVDSPSGALPLLGMLGGAASASPSKAEQLAAAADAAGATQQQQQQQQGTDSDMDHPLPLRVMDGPSTNPEPPLEGLSPPHADMVGLAGTAGADAAPDQAAAAAAAGDPDAADAAADADAAAADPARLILPPELREPPPGQPSEGMQARVESIYRTQMQTGKSIVSVLRKNRRWQNPDFLEKMVRYYHLDQYGSSLSSDVFDPKGIPDEDKWPALAAVLQQRKRARGAEVQFRSSGQQQQQQAGAGAAAAAAAAAALPGGGGAAAAGSGLPAAPKMLPPDPRKVEVAQAQAQALANALLSNATKKSKWDK